MLERETGVCKPFNLAKSMGVELTDPKGDKHGYGAERVPTFTLGIADASPLEMAEAYATFAARGLHCASRPVTSIADASGHVLKRYRQDCQQVMKQSTGDAVNYVLRGVQEPGGFGYQQGTGLTVPSAAKTGTTQDGKAVWYVGYTPQIATAAMIAGASKDGGKPIRLVGQTIRGSYVYQVSGSGFAGPMWADAMHAIQGRLKDIDFVAPQSSSVQGIPVTVPSVSGMSVADAKRTLEQAGFHAIEAGQTNSTLSAGLVASTTPSGGSTAPQGSVISLYTSNGIAPPKPHHAGGGGGGSGGGGGKPGKGKPGKPGHH
jgi:membrane peptidoglycan carboxypeptidase